jgi:hypothetical protein
MFFGRTSKQILSVALVTVAAGGIYLEAGAKSLVHAKPVRKAKESVVISGTNSPAAVAGPRSSNESASNVWTNSVSPSSEEIITTDAEEKVTVRNEIDKLDSEITESLGKLTQYQNLKSANRKISRLYVQELKAERKNLSEKERELSGALKLKDELEQE